MPAFPSAGEFTKEFSEQIKKNTASSAPSELTVVEKLPDNYVKAVINIATYAWRIRGKVADSSGDANSECSKDDIKKVLRYVDGIVDALTSIDIDIKDRIGQPFDFGLPEKVVTTVAQVGICKEMIRETLRPTIYWRSQIAQQGEIILATPEEAGKQTGTNDLESEPAAESTPAGEGIKTPTEPKQSIGPEESKNKPKLEKNK